MEAVIMLILTHGDFKSRIGAHEECAIIMQVAEAYKLDAEETKLLAVIRRIENGRPGNEFGVHSEEPGHASHRYAGQPAASVRLQAQYAAGTIWRHYRSDVPAFARTWCPTDSAGWAKNAEFYMRMK